ncbi:MAG: proteasome activator [Nitriliruptoraceae bacterium]
MSDAPNGDALAGSGGPPSGDGSPTALEHVAEEDTRDAIAEPARLIRIASTVQTLLAEVQTTELDEAARQRLTEIHNRTVEDLRSVVSGDLGSELDELSLEPEDGTPTGAELRVMQAQLSGWLQGLFHGIQASIATQQLAAQQQLARMREQPGTRESEEPVGHRYL